ncbi:MAG: hypothetical protein ABFS39_07575 [Pseudomonadota bacterium]
MKILYDMSTGRVLEAPRQERMQTQFHFQETHPLPELKLQEINTDYREEQRIPPELAITDLNGFLKEMS